ncbi:MAG TPA: CHAT domain-containing protein, partial [Puia sp.]|nr:CHAT domain-containing protein [Puia sp.]
RKYQQTKNPKDLESAIGVYRTADRLMDKINESQQDLSSQLFWRSDTRRLYERAIEACYLTGNLSNAFYFFEKSRAVILNDQLNQQNRINNSDILREAQIKKKILMLERARKLADVNTSQFIEVQKDLIFNRQALNRMQQLTRRNNPLYYQNSMDTAFITIRDLRKQVFKNYSALLEIFSGDSAVYALLISPQDVHFQKIRKSDFDSSAIRYLSYLSNSSLLNSQFDNYSATAEHLYQIIFKQAPVPDGRIIISPDGRLFPFEALITNSDKSNPFFFLTNHSVTYTYSARYLLTRFASDSSNTSINFLGVAPVQYTAGKTLLSLNGSDNSLTRIESYYGEANNLIRADASKMNFQSKYSEYSIIQLYTHASDTSAQNEPVIYFADSALYLSDLIQENKPKTRLIVLSACETGNGILYRGEGVFSFNRGFASLGIPSSISNLWSVDNKATYEITEFFYKYLADGMPADVALQKAKLDFIRKGPRHNKLPYYWASAILVGKSDSIRRNKTFPWKDITIVFGLLGLCFLFMRKRKGSGN